MQGEREVKGMVTWKSICSRLALGCKINRVADCCEDARIVDANRTLFDVIPTLVEYVSTPEQDCIAFRSKDASMMPTRMPSSRAYLVDVRLGSDRLWACRRCCGVERRLL